MIITNTPEFLNDLMDVVRLFYPNGGAPEITHRHRVECGRNLESATAPGYPPAEFSSPTENGLLAEKRARKRAAKICIYELLKTISTQHPPWGSLTGIRPTRLLYEAMEAGMTPQQAEHHMIECYDVDESRAKLLSDVLAMQRGLIEHAPNAFDLYIGIPFCTTRCAYCSFASGELGNGKLVEPYLDALIREMDQCAELMHETGYHVRAAYMGGGTPTALSASQLDRVLSAAQNSFPGALEWTVEAGRPDTIDQEKLRVLKRHGIHRISINPQSFSDATLQRIGRSHTKADTLNALELARREGFHHINMDLIAALPGESLEDFASTLQQTIDLSPESITVHTLSIKHGSKLHEFGNENPTDADLAGDMVNLARETLISYSYHPYYLYRQKYMAGNFENVGYAKSGHACMYNIDIMEETCSILALGAGAITKWLFDRERRIERAPNLKSIEQYIARVDDMVLRKRNLINDQ